MNHPDRDREPQILSRAEIDLEQRCHDQDNQDQDRPVDDEPGQTPPRFGDLVFGDCPVRGRFSHVTLLSASVPRAYCHLAAAGRERQSVAIARAAYFGAKVLILDEPTSALGVRQSGMVLKYIIEAKNRGLGVIFITHNPNHAFPVGDRFLILNRGKSMGDFRKDEISRDQLIMMMAGGAELEELTRELERAGTNDREMAHVAQEFAEELEELEDRAERAE